jgi:hypothetical protein
MTNRPEDGWTVQAKARCLIRNAIADVLAVFVLAVMLGLMFWFGGFSS